MIFLRTSSMMINIQQKIVEVMELKRSASEWADRCKSMINCKKSNRKKYLQTILKSDFSLDISVNRFIEEYVNAIS